MPWTDRYDFNYSLLVLNWCKFMSWYVLTYWIQLVYAFCHDHSVFFHWIGYSFHLRLLFQLQNFARMLLSFFFVLRFCSIRKLSHHHYIFPSFPSVIASTTASPAAAVILIFLLVSPPPPLAMTGPHGQLASNYDFLGKSKQCMLVFIHIDTRILYDIPVMVELLKYPNDDAWEKWRRFSKVEILELVPYHLSELVDLYNSHNVYTKGYLKK